MKEGGPEKIEGTEFEIEADLIVAAIGHESDTTIIELVADVRASTPTQAVMTLIPDGEELLHMIHQLDSRMRQSMKQFLKQQRITIASKGAPSSARVFGIKP